MTQNQDEQSPDTRPKPSAYVIVLLVGAAVMFAAGIVFAVLEVTGYLR